MSISRKAQRRQVREGVANDLNAKQAENSTRSVVINDKPARLIAASAVESDVAVRQGIVDGLAEKDGLVVTVPFDYPFRRVYPPNIYSAAEISAEREPEIFRKVDTTIPDVLGEIEQRDSVYTVPLYEEDDSMFKSRDYTTKRSL